MKGKQEFLGFDTHEYRPIIRDRSVGLLKKLIEKYQPKRVLEIGTFIGYSASVMLDACKDCFVTTIEKDPTNAKDAQKNLNELGFDGRFEVVNMDAFDFLQGQENEQIYDFIFLDGPKGQYIKYLPYLKKLLKIGGVLVADDILFYGLVRFDGYIEHKHRTIVYNLRKFLKALDADKDFETEIFEFDDGVSVSIKKSNDC